MTHFQTLEEAKQVCPTTARRMAEEGALMVDVRERFEVEQLAFDVPAIVNIPLFELEQRWADLPMDRDVVLVCYSGERSLKATYYLQYHGYTRVCNMEGGLVKWLRKGFPVIGQRYDAPAEGSCCCGGSTEVAEATGCCGSESSSCAPESACCASVTERAGCHG
ncbi:MAG: rhodanese-like domain-containing protein [Tepidimonas sp.]|uniref:rhodanese-like domain-containing protein n=1 Tax=Tepidimonas sp. TaxID=2002775 RepID=UPI00259E988B|nr:rhodanese-like domain-containing protein [Tepidimonas sp.]MDM7457107.1 rhodanese-like domain-containing protein [Tepidimonas sp.]